MTEVLIPRIVGFPLSESQVLMTPAEVAALFRVDPKTVTRWADAGKLTAVRTLGGHRRYRQDEVQNLLVASSLAPAGLGVKSSESASV
jgi:excisionase family DNA binding protein